MRRSFYDEHAAVDCGYLFKQAVGAVAGAIVDKDKFEGVADLLHDGLETVVEGRDVLFLVVERHDDGNISAPYDDTPAVRLPGPGKDEVGRGLCKF